MYMQSKTTDFLKRSACTLMPNGAQVGKTGNSVVTSSLVTHLDGLFPDLSKIQTTCSLVEIRGASNEPTHYHTSHLVGLVIRGHGYLREPQQRQPVKKGDIVVIPRGVQHYFDCDDAGELDYIAYEVSDQDIDYQKHF